MNSGKEWQSQSYVLETESEKDKQSCLFEVFGADKIRQFDLHVGDRVKVTFDMEARESNGRYFGHNRAWKVEKV